MEGTIQEFDSCDSHVKTFYHTGYKSWKVYPYAFSEQVTSDTLLQNTVKKKEGVLIEKRGHTPQVSF